MLPLRLVLGTAIIAILGSLWYYAFIVTWWALVGIVVVATLVAWWVPLREIVKSDRRESRGDEGSKEKVKSQGNTALLVLLAIVALGAWWNAVLAVEITDAVRSPWLVLSPFSIVALGIAMGACVLLFVQRAHRTGVVMLGAILFSALSMAAAVYPHGIGFDPFLHRATVAHIAEFGSITPKPLYYTGQYALELVLVVIGHLPLVTVDRFLLPVFAVIALLTSAWYGLATVMRKRHVALAALLLLPLGALISTTPQGIAYVFALSAIFLTHAATRRSLMGLRLAPWLLAIAAMLTHPFAGIPTMLYVTAWQTLQLTHRAWVERTVLVASGVAAFVAIPALFAFQAARSGLALQLHVGNIFDASRWQALALDGFLRNQFSTWYDGLYLVVGNFFTIAVVLGIIGYIARQRLIIFRSQNNETLTLGIVFAAGMFANFLALSIVFDFDFLIAYERSDYAVRALTLTHLFLMPGIVAAVAFADEYLAHKPRALRMTLLVLLAAVGMANVYGAYPRHDNYARSAGFNVSTADFDAVAAIAQDAGDEDNYIVLANQATSAAAVEVYGFKKYYHTDIFYYPIPTGGPMYEQFLSMVNVAPTRETMLAAMDIASDTTTGVSVDLGYFAVSDYWWKSEMIIENAKREADDWFAVDDGKVTVFIYRR